jgi:hypothetical protein
VSDYRIGRFAATVAAGAVILAATACSAPGSASAAPSDSSTATVAGVQVGPSNSGWNCQYGHPDGNGMTIVLVINSASVPTCYRGAAAEFKAMEDGVSLPLATWTYDRYSDDPPQEVPGGCDVQNLNAAEVSILGAPRTPVAEGQAETDANAVCSAAHDASS